MTGRQSRRDLLVEVAGVEVVRWNPRVARSGLRWPLSDRSRPRRDNFGDLLGPLVVQRLATVADPSATGRGGPTEGAARLLAVGSILHFAVDGDVVWGAGANGKIDQQRHRWRTLDVRAVRGPLTERFLLAAGQHVPPVHGDPAQLLPHLFPVMRHWATRRSRALTVVPNLNDAAALSGHPAYLDPTTSLEECLRTIVQSELVIGSSLHSVVVAEAFGVPARFVRSVAEHEFKYLDYLAATGRPGATICASVAEAERLGGYEAPTWDPGPLLDAFPHDLWDRGPAVPTAAPGRPVRA